MGFIDRLKTRAAAAPAAVTGVAWSGAQGGAAAHASAPGSFLAAHSAMPADSSIASEAAGSGMGTGFGDTRHPPAASGPAEPAPGALPLIGRRPVAQQQRILFVLIAAGLAILGVALWAGIASDLRGARQSSAVGQVQIQAGRMALAATQAVAGSPSAAVDLRSGAQLLASGLGILADSDILTLPVRGAGGERVGTIGDLGESLQKQTATVLAQEKALALAGEALRAMERRSAEMLLLAQTVLDQKVDGGAAPAEISAVSALAMMTQRIAKNAGAFLSLEGADPETLQVLGRDLVLFGELIDGTMSGSAALGLPGTRDAMTLGRLKALQRQFVAMRGEASAMLDNVPSLLAARQSQQAIVRDAERLQAALDETRSRLADQRGLGPVHMWALALAMTLLVAGTAGMLRLFVLVQTHRSREAEAQRAEAELQEREAKRVNDANQSAILRLMNELQAVAEGDLTQQATVTEDITGAIADSVNYTVEELRSLASQVQLVVHRVTRATQQVELTSTELLATSAEQLREIRDAGEAVLQMAARINDVSGQALRCAEVARQSLQVSASGHVAVQNTIGGMNAIRDQIQETSKRIKRLGESSQEIGEITDLISDITEQTNVLALNAAIQAASAGEAGRGFSVVAEEVQRLAERSADATRQISALVRAIQTDTLDAVAAMERSTLGVVEGARLTDAAGNALNDIDRVTRELATLIERISAQASNEAQSAGVVASSIQHIFAVTEQTSEGTKSTAQIVRELSRTAEELRASVARFKVN
jgi:twitching motility protein PilJ